MLIKINEKQISDESDFSGNIFSCLLCRNHVGFEKGIKGIKCHAAFTVIHSHDTCIQSEE